ncbi:MAG: OmpA family protein [Sulfuritalea sp.]|nr:OmpA family protein [Sulfuritalea sp.]
MNQIIKNMIVLAAVLATPYTASIAQTTTGTGTATIDGVIVTRDGDSFMMRSKTGTVTNVTLAKSTKINEGLGLLGVRTETMSSASLVPGLRISVEPESAGPKVVAKSVKFSTNDLETADAIQAALAVPQQQIQALMQELAAQKQQNATQDQQIAATGKRIGDLAEYDLKAEIKILFDVNSATLSDKAKEELKTLAAKAKTYKGYLIQVVGHADAQGTARSNQALSENRAATVVHYLQQEAGVALSRVLTPVAMGESKASAANEAGANPESRRVTVRIAVNRGIGE